MKVAILYICTGKYDVFWKDFFLSAEQYLLNDCEKHYYVFSDAESIFEENHPSVHFTRHEKKEWPYPTLLRFETFLTKEKELKEFDYIYFFNANMLFVAPVGREILPSKEEGLVMVQHPYLYKKARWKCPFERNKESMAYIPWWRGKNYVQGSLNGGTAEAYLKLVRALKENVQKDLDKEIIAVWWDESHLNKYVLDKKYKILTPAYNFAEGSDKLPFTPKIVIRDKENWGGHELLRDSKAE